MQSPGCKSIAASGSPAAGRAALAGLDVVGFRGAPQQGCRGVGAVLGLIAVGSPVSAHPLEHWLHSGDAQASLPRGIWNLHGPGNKPVSLASAGELSTTGPPGKSPWTSS